jgi:ribonuclease-3
MERKRKTKGDITISKANIENNLNLAEKGKRLRLLEKKLILEAIKDQEKLVEGSETILADTVEALIGAVFIDSKCSIEKTKKCIERIFDEELGNLEILS